MGATLAPPRRLSNRVSLHLNNSSRKHFKSEKETQGNFPLILSAKSLVLTLDSWVIKIKLFGLWIMFNSDGLGLTLALLPISSDSIPETRYLIPLFEPH